MKFPDSLKYTREHEWARIKGKKAVVGITDYAQKELGDIVYVELPEVGDEVVQDEQFGVVESIKTVSDLFSAVSGEVTKVNDDLEDRPELVNEDPYGSGWMMEVTISEMEELENLLSAEEYEEFVAEESGEE